MAIKLIPGQLWYRNGRELRIIRPMGGDSVSVYERYNNEPPKRRRIDRKMLFQDYTYIDPDCYIFFNGVEFGKYPNMVRDVVVTVLRNTEFGRESLPAVTVRQNIVNIFSTMIMKSEYYEVGMSITPETAPEGFDYRQMTACDRLDRNNVIAAYKDYTLENILFFLKGKDIAFYDAILEELYCEHYNYLDDDHKHEADLVPNYHGYCRTLKGLLQHTGFMMDYDKAFGTTPLSTFDMRQQRIEGDIRTKFMIPPMALVPLYKELNIDPNKYIFTFIYSMDYVRKIENDGSDLIEYSKNCSRWIRDINGDLYLIFFAEIK